MKTLYMSSAKFSPADFADEEVNIFKLKCFSDAKCTDNTQKVIYNIHQYIYEKVQKFVINF